MDRTVPHSKELFSPNWQWGEVEKPCLNWLQVNSLHIANKTTVKDRWIEMNRIPFTISLPNFLLDWPQATCKKKYCRLGFPLWVSTECVIFIFVILSQMYTFDTRLDHYSLKKQITATWLSIPSVLTLGWHDGGLTPKHLVHVNEVCTTGEKWVFSSCLQEERQLPSDPCERRENNLCLWGWERKDPVFSCLPSRMQINLKVKVSSMTNFCDLMMSPSSSASFPLEM